MAKHRSHSVAFKRQVAQEFIAGETLHSLAKRHDISRNLTWRREKPRWRAGPVMARNWRASASRPSLAKS